MAAKGAQLKSEITKKILETFPGSFLYNDGKEIRINGTEDGQNLQIKVALTCAKVAVGLEDEIPETSEGEKKILSFPMPKPQPIDEPSEDEKERLKTLLEKLGL